MNPDLPPPRVERAAGRVRVRWQLTEVLADEDGQLVRHIYPMGNTDDPRVALVGVAARLRDRESWLGPDPDPVELAEVAAMRAKAEAMAQAVARFEAAR